VTEHDEKDGHEGLRYTVRFLIKHPSINPALITQRLHINPSGPTWTVGTARSTPKGTSLPGVYRESVWSHSVEVHDKRSFFDEVVQLLEHLEPNAEFLRELTDSGGHAELILDLFGDRNIGDSISWEHLRRLAALRVNLGVEVF
jgi:Domain of unknown function (DUF4279)